MSQQVQALIARAKNAPVELVTITVPDPGPGEAVVNIQACGVPYRPFTRYRAGLVRTFLTCWDMRRQVSWRLWVTESPISNPATMLS